VRREVPGVRGAALPVGLPLGGGAGGGEGGRRRGGRGGVEGIVIYLGKLSLQDASHCAVVVVVVVVVEAHSA